MRDATMRCKNIECRKIFIRDNHAQRYCKKCRKERRVVRLIERNEDPAVKQYKVVFETRKTIEVQVDSTSELDAQRVAWQVFPENEERQAYYIKSIQDVSEY